MPPADATRMRSPSLSSRGNDFGTGRPPRAEAVKLATRDGVGWNSTADYKQRESKPSLQLGADDLMVIFDERFIEALDLSDPERSRASGMTPPCDD